MKSIGEYLEEDYKKWGDNPYISIWIGTSYQARTFRETIEDVWCFAGGLLHNQDGATLQNKNIMLYSENSYEWMVIDLAIMGYIGTCVPVDKEWTAYDISHAMNSIDVAACFYSKAKEVTIKELKKHYPNVKYYCIDEVFQTVIKEGYHEYVLNQKTAEEHSSNSKIDQTFFAKLPARTDMNQTAMILFTSGTTNIAKAIPLSQSNLFSNWDTLYQRTPMTEKDISFVFLPLNHVYSGVANFLYSIISGMQIYLCSDMKKLVPEMMLVRPTVVCMVPLILKRIYESILPAIIPEDECNPTTKEVHSLFESVMDMLRHIRFLYCGGSFTDFEIKKYFIDQKVNLIEAYGTTETSSVIALDRLGDTNIRSNGVVFENLDVKILDADENGVGEILVKGGSVSKGYLNSPNNNTEFDENGYYHTGDLAMMDESRHLYLKGRKKRMIITANGKNVYVDELEALILENEEMKKVVVYEEDHHITAAIVTNLKERDVQNYIDQVNLKLPGFKKIKRLHVKADVIGGRIK